MSRCTQLHFINTWSAVSQPTFSPSPVFLLTVELGMWCDCLAGVTLNWGVLLAWSGLRGSLDWSVAPLYLACVLYTMFYDTIYSHQVLALPLSPLPDPDPHPTLLSCRFFKNSGRQVCFCFVFKLQVWEDFFFLLFFFFFLLSPSDSLNLGAQVGGGGAWCLISETPKDHVFTHYNIT